MKLLESALTNIIGAGEKMRNVSYTQLYVRDFFDTAVCQGPAQHSSRYNYGSSA